MAKNMEYWKGKFVQSEANSPFNKNGVKDKVHELSDKAKQFVNKVAKKVGDEISFPGQGTTVVSSRNYGKGDRNILRDLISKTSPKSNRGIQLRKELRQTTNPGDMR
jgi:hypothetical protein